MVKPSIPVGVDGIEDLSDVAFVNLNDGEYLVYDAVAGEWANQALPGGVDGTFINLSDVDDSSYTGKGGWNIQVNATGTGVAFVDASVIDGGSF